MAVRFSDQDIQAFLAEPKPLPENYERHLRLRNKRGHKEQELEIKGEGDHVFRLILRQCDINKFDFSVILGVIPQGSNQLFRLCRYNGKSHEHTNIIENQTFYDYHIHTATERYQALGMKEDAFAEPTSRFSDFRSAYYCIIEDCEFITPSEDQGILFKQGPL